MFLNGGAGRRPLFLRARGETPPSPDEPDPVARDMARAGLEVRTCRHRFQGQADVIALDRNRFILTYADDPAGTSRDSLDEIKALLPMGAQTLEVALQPPYTAGSQGIAYLAAPGGAKVLLQNRAALASHTPEEVSRFAGHHIESFVLLAEDAAAYVTKCLVVRGTVILGQGSSTILRGLLARRGFPLAETDVSALFAEGRGGPRLLANDLPGLVLSDDAPSYALRREELLERHASYRPAPSS
jgi:hypothetical protein